jgi:hypothetical protein
LFGNFLFQFLQLRDIDVTKFFCRNQLAPQMSQRGQVVNVILKFVKTRAPHRVETIFAP